ncbi:P-loop containing nucleoside triphosphate hydrolase protein, partial [Caulochytrium protostelioides]
YYKHAIMTRLDETLGDIYTRIVDRELDLLQSVREDVLHYGAAMTALADRLADLDALASMAHTARILGWVRPHLTRTRGIHIEDGRHPLVEMAGGSAFRRPHRAGEGILLTGPNSSGKSVYVKQTGVIVFLSHIGSYVPARRARIGMVDHLMTRLQTSESVSRPESAFVIDVRQVAHALQIATPRSLLLMDEFGKGTDAGNGISLFCGVLKYLLNFPKRGDDPSTASLLHHDHALHRDLPLCHVPSDPQEGVVPTRIDSLSATMVPQFTLLYAVKPGRSSVSWGLACAQVAGIPPGILRLARWAHARLVN